MARYFVQDTSLTAIADAIRAKTGGTAALTLDGMAQAVKGIQTGGGGGGGGFPNGTEWTEINTGGLNITYVHRANGLWVAGTYNQGLIYSTDGKTWTKSNDTNGRFNNIYFLNGKWYATYIYSNYKYSEDGKVWTAGNRGLLTIDYYRGLWVAGSGGGLLYSTDGTNWTKSNVTSGELYVQRVGGIYFAFSGTTCGSSGIWCSTDGMTWTKSNITSGTCFLVSYEDGLYVATSPTHGLLYSTDGLTWMQSNVTSASSLSAISWSRIRKEDGVWVAALGSLYYSTDGMTWTDTGITGCFGVGYANGVWSTGKYYSTDGMSWNPCAKASTTTGEMAFGDGMWISYGYSGMSRSVAWEPSN